MKYTKKETTCVKNLFKRLKYAKLVQTEYDNRVILPYLCWLKRKLAIK